MSEDDFGRRNRAHIDIGAFRETARYEFPSRPRQQKFLRENYAEHAASLLTQLTTVLGVLPTVDLDTRLHIEGLKLGAIIEVTTLAPAGTLAKAAKVPMGLEFPTQDIVVLRTQRNDDRTESATLFVPDDARTFLRGRVSNYGRDPGNASRPDLDRFQSVEAIRAVMALDLFQGVIDLADPRPIWWELWVHGSATRAGDIARAASRQNLDVHADQLVFPDTTVLFLHGNAPSLVEFAGRVPGAIAEVRKATGTIETFLLRDGQGLGQQDWVDDLVGRVVPPQDGAPVVCTLDTGVAAGHPLLQPGLQAAWAYDEAWGTDDHHPQGGHGTGLAGLVLYGDLEALMNGGGPVELTHGAESMKLLPPRGFPATAPPSYGVVTQGAVALVETERPHEARAFCLATSAPDFPPTRPSSWSGALDQIAAGAMEGDVVPDVPASRRPKRLIVVAVGNMQGGQRDHVAGSHPLEDPSQSWNALSIGGFTRKDQAPAAPPVLTPVVSANERSPYSRGSQGFPDDLTPLKPEVLFEAGNMVADAGGHCGWHDAVSLLSTGSDAAEPLVPFWATSAAAGMAGNFLGRLQAALPRLWPETYRALTVDSANWPGPIRRLLIGRGNHWKTMTKQAVQRALREVGYGVPDLDRAVRSARNEVTLVAQSEIQPFTIGADGRSGVFNEMHFYDLPWPRSSLEQLENEVVTMKVTLSYFIEPNLTGKAATRPDTYRSFGLRFAMKKRSESEVRFRARVTASQETDGSATEPETSHWLLGPKAIQAGSLHCDLWRGFAIDLAGHDAVAIYPVGGWWKSHTGQRRMTDSARYALTISIAAPGHSVDLHAEISNLVAVRTGTAVVSSGPVN